MTKQQLAELKQAILEHQTCAELAATANNLVMGDGNPQAKIMLIGEAPGKNEDLEGRPFVGAAGKFLDEMIASVGLAREQVYITNIVKYRPPNNRDPLPEEKAAFWPFLLQEILLVDPEVLVTLGRHSMEYFLPQAKISQVHGNLQRRKFKFPGGNIKPLTILPLYHPAAALYNGSLRQTLIDDFAQLKSLATPEVE